MSRRAREITSYSITSSASNFPWSCSLPCRPRPPLARLASRSPADSFFSIGQKKRDQIGIICHCALQDLQVFLPACHQVFPIVPTRQRPGEKIGDANQFVIPSLLRVYEIGYGKTIIGVIGCSSSCVFGKTLRNRLRRSNPRGSLGGEPRLTDYFVVAATLRRTAARDREAPWQSRPYGLRVKDRLRQALCHLNTARSIPHGSSSGLS
jgi:hypothetical protein